MSDQLYPSDMTDRERGYIKDMIPAAKLSGRKRVTDMCRTLNAIFTTDRSGSERGFDAGKKTAGRKLHILVDTLVLLLLVVVRSAGIQDRDGVRKVLSTHPLFHTSAEDLGGWNLYWRLGGVGTKFTNPKSIRL
jgi:hypothetical protein